MKKIILFLITLLFLTITDVDAANYEIKELIPNNIKTTVKGENLTYKGIIYDNDKISIEKIINNSYDEQFTSVSIGLFNDKKTNIGTVIYCEENKLQRKEFKDNIIIELDKKYLGENESKENIKYISVISENENCRKDGFHDFLGQKVEDIGKINTTGKDEDAALLINIVTIVAVGLVLMFLYKVLFTTKYNNMDNEDVRNAFKNNQKELEKERLKEQANKKPEIVPKEEKPKLENSETSLEDYYK